MSCARSETGFTLIEVLVSALMVILIGSATAGALIVSSHFSGDQRLRSQADALAAQDQERLRGLSDEQLSGLSQTRTVAGTSFNITSVATFVDTTGASSCASTGVAYYKIVSTVSWTENFSHRPPTLSTESLLARPVSGDLLTHVSDESGLQGLAGVTVTATGPSTQSDRTDTSGCVVFAGLTAGSYSVVMAEPNYVDPNGNASTPPATATVTSTATTTTLNGGPFRLGLAGSVAGTFATGMAGVAGEADTISWLGNGASFGMSGGYRSSTPLASMATAITTNPLFPFDVSPTLPATYANNYTVWAGVCLQMEPPSGVNQSTVVPGSIGTALSLQEPPLWVRDVYYNNVATPVKPAHVKLTYTSTAGTSCSDSWYPTVSSATGTAPPATGWLANPGQPFATTATSGPTASAASLSGPPQTGTFSLCADYSGFRGYTTVPFTNTSFTSLNLASPVTIMNSSPGLC